MSPILKKYATTAGTSFVDSFMGIVASGLTGIAAYEIGKMVAKKKARKAAKEEQE